MLRVLRPSGQELAAISAEEFTDAGAVKKHLCEQYGFPTYLQKLLLGGRLLTDDAKMDGAMDLHLVLLTVSSLSPIQQGYLDSELVYAAAGNRIHTVRFLVEAGADKDCKLVSGKTALMLASANGHLEVARLLVEAGAQVDAKDPSRMTALMLATKCGHLGVARLLLEAGAEMECRDGNGRTACCLHPRRATCTWR